MDCFVEGIILGIDSILLISCIRQYFDKKKTMALIASAPVLQMDSNLKKTISSQPDHKFPFVVLRGTVKALGNPIISNNNPQVSGVMQTLRIKEHVVQRNSTGFWADSERTLQEVHNVMPFGLESKGVVIEVVDPLVAEYLEMEVISDTFHPTVPSVMDHIWGFFAGVRQRGIQSTEKMLRQGTVLTGIGELVSDEDKTLKLQPRGDGLYYLTSLPISSLLKKIESSKNNFALLCFICSAVGTFLCALLVRKYLNHRKQLKEDEERRSRSEETRKYRRRLIRDTKDLSENQLCVVCKTNPIEMILLPCGHVCLCEDCADDITGNCPICRTDIDFKTAAYVP